MPSRPFRRLLVSLVACLAWTPSPSVAAEPPAVAVAAEWSVTETGLRLVLVTSREVNATSFVLEKPDRVIVDLPGLHCRLPADIATRRQPGFVAGFRCGLLALGRTRLVVDLAAPAAIARLAWQDGPVPAVRHLVLDLAPTGRDAFRRAAAARLAPDPDTTGSLGRAPEADVRPLVAIDAGHGGVDSGAVAVTGAFEKDVVLAFARALRDRLVEGGQVRVLMVRDADVFVPLDERVRLARGAGADLFVSVHGDAMSSAAGRGATIYTGAERATDAESAGLAERENAADAASGLVTADARAGVQDILHDLTLRETRGLSHRVAGRLQAALAGVTRLTPQPHREAGFRVLRAPDMTSVLVELGYLSNAQDASLLQSGDWRARSAAAMADAIERFFGPRLAGHAAVSP